MFLIFSAALRLVLGLAFFINFIGPVPCSWGDDFILPPPGAMVHLSPAFDPAVLKGIKVHPDNPFHFEFILDKGDSHLPLKAESLRLIKYFLTALTIPEQDLWVNLSPYEKNRIIPKSFGLTAMGRDLLAEDYMLKQITSSLIYPEGETGKKFWKKVYAQAAKRFGTTDIPVNTFNKVWIVPEKAVVYENAKAGTAYVVESKLKVMLEEDYLSQAKHGDIGVLQNGDCPVNIVSQGTVPILRGSNIHMLGAQIIREIVLPELTREANTDKNFAQLRQIYNSVILAAWYKKKIKDSILSLVYENKRKIAGMGYKNSLPLVGRVREGGDIEAIYQQYLKAFKKGVFNYIKDEIDSASKQVIPRRYFSGGFNLQVSQAMVSSNRIDKAVMTQKKMVVLGIYFRAIMAKMKPLSSPFEDLIYHYLINPDNTEPGLLAWLRENHDLMLKEDLEEEELDFKGKLVEWFFDRERIHKSKILKTSAEHGSAILLKLIEAGVFKRHELTNVWLDNLKKISFLEKPSSNAFIAQVQQDQENGFDDIDALMDDLTENGYLVRKTELGRTVHQLTNKFVMLSQKSKMTSQKFNAHQMQTVYKFIHLFSSVPDTFELASIDINENQIHGILKDVATQEEITKVWRILKRSIADPRLVSQVIPLFESVSSYIGLYAIGKRYPTHLVPATLAMAKMAMHGNKPAQRMMGAIYDPGESQHRYWMGGHWMIEGPESRFRHLIKGLVAAKAAGSPSASYALGLIIAEHPGFSDLDPDYIQDIEFAAIHGSSSAMTFFVQNHTLFRSNSKAARKIAGAQEFITQILAQVNSIAYIHEDRFYTSWIDNFSSYIFHLASAIPQEESLTEQLKTLRESTFNVVRPFFWSRALSEEIMVHRTTDGRFIPWSKKRTAIVVYPKHDPTGVYMSERRLEELSRHFKVLYFEAGSAKELAMALKEGRRYGQASLVVIGDGILNTAEDEEVMQKAGLNNLLRSGASGVLEGSNISMANALAQATGRVFFNTEPRAVATSYFYSNGHKEVIGFLPGASFYQAHPKRIIHLTHGSYYVFPRFYEIENTNAVPEPKGPSVPSNLLFMLKVPEHWQLSAMSGSASMAMASTGINSSDRAMMDDFNPNTEQSFQESTEQEYSGTMQGLKDLMHQARKTGRLTESDINGKTWYLDHRQENPVRVRVIGRPYVMDMGKRVKGVLLSRNSERMPMSRFIQNFSADPIQTNGAAGVQINRERTQAISDRNRPFANMLSHLYALSIERRAKFDGRLTIGVLAKMLQVTDNNVKRWLAGDALPELERFPNIFRVLMLTRQERADLLLAWVKIHHPKVKKGTLEEFLVYKRAAMFTSPVKMAMLLELPETSFLRYESGVLPPKGLLNRWLKKLNLTKTEMEMAYELWEAKKKGREAAMELVNRSRAVQQLGRARIANSLKPESLRTFLKDWRLSRLITVEKMAESLGVTVSIYQSIENQGIVPKDDVFEKIVSQMEPSQAAEAVRLRELAIQRRDLNQTRGLEVIAEKRKIMPPEPASGKKFGWRLRAYIAERMQTDRNIDYKNYIYSRNGEQIRLSNLDRYYSGEYRPDLKTLAKIFRIFGMTNQQEAQLRDQLMLDRGISLDQNTVGSFLAYGRYQLMLEPSEVVALANKTLDANDRIDEAKFYGLYYDWENARRPPKDLKAFNAVLQVLKLSKTRADELMSGSNRAQIASDKTGGIDLTSVKNPQIQNNGKTISFHIDPAMMQKLQKAQGFVPVIARIDEGVRLGAFLGISG